MADVLQHSLEPFLQGPVSGRVLTLHCVIKRRISFTAHFIGIFQIGKSVYCKVAFMIHSVPQRYSWYQPHIVTSIFIFASRIQAVFTVVIYCAKHHTVQVCTREYMLVHKVLRRFKQSVWIQRITCVLCICFVVYFWLTNSHETMYSDRNMHSQKYPFRFGFEAGLKFNLNDQVKPNSGGHFNIDLMISK